MSSQCGKLTVKWLTSEVRTNDGKKHVIRFFFNGRGRGGKGVSRCSEALIGCAMESGAQNGEASVAPGRTEKRNAKGKTVGPLSGGYGKRSRVEQVRKIGVASEG